MMPASKHMMPGLLCQDLHKQRFSEDGTNLLHCITVVVGTTNWSHPQSTSACGDFGGAAQRCALSW